MRPFIRFAVAAGMVLAAQISSAQEPAATQPAVEPSVTPPPVTPPPVAPPPPSETQPLAVPATPAQASSTSPVQTPGRGLTMAQVKDKHGSPSHEVAAVGTPPISRWEYPGYVVFFESDRVLHTVVTPR